MPFRTRSDHVRMPSVKPILRQAKFFGGHDVRAVDVHVAAQRRKESDHVLQNRGLARCQRGGDPGEIHEAVGALDLHRIPRAGHWSAYENAPEVNRLMLEFFES